MEPPAAFVHASAGMEKEGTAKHIRDCKRKPHPCVALLDRKCCLIVAPMTPFVSPYVSSPTVIDTTNSTVSETDQPISGKDPDNSEYAGPQQYFPIASHSIRCAPRARSLELRTLPRPERAVGQLPMKCAGRFSVRARRASRESSVDMTTAWWEEMRSSAVRRSCFSPSFALRLIICTATGG